MQCTWVAGGLKEVCAAERSLRGRFGTTAATAVMFVLTVIAQSDNLGDLRTFRSVQLVPLPPTKKHLGRLLIRHKEIDVTTEMLTNDAVVVYDADSDPSDWMDPIRSVRILTITKIAA